jgi:hypothetical protein
MLVLDRLITGRPLRTDLTPSERIAVAAEPPVHGWMLVGTQALRVTQRIYLFVGLRVQIFVRDVWFNLCLRLDTSLSDFL